ncbi:unnamed protein product [Phytomonas sp. EM1]|nr:unnamed protein product [Phytomonas sp. EM1]|eukprot:CCW64165.1 unnamed protein product [Phytomonas sp. isolate EM1]
MTLLTGQPHHRPAVLLTRLVCLLLILSCGMGTTAGLFSTTVKVWITGPAATWAYLSNSKTTIFTDIETDIKKLYSLFHFVSVTTHSPHTASNSGDVRPSALKADGIGLDAEITVKLTTSTEDEVRNILRKAVFTTVNNKFPELGGSLKVFPFMPDEVTVHIASAAIAINTPTYLWEMYLKKEEPLIPKGNVYHATDEVLRYLPIDLKNALNSSQDAYLIMPTQLWTNTSGTYINYTVYATPNAEPHSTLTPEQIYRKLVNSTLPRFSEKINKLVISDDDLNPFKDLLRLPITLRPYLPPRSPNPPVPPYLSTVRTQFIIRFSGNQEKWKETILIKGKQLSDSIATSARNVLDRLFYDTEVFITRTQPVKDGAKQIEGLLVYGEVGQHRKVGGQHPWDPKDILSVLKQGDYSAAISFYIGEPASVKLIAVGFDADFGPTNNSHGTALIVLCVFFLIITILSLALCFIWLHLFTKKRVKFEECDGNFYETPALVNDEAASFYSAARTNSTLRLETIDEQRIPVIVDNPLRATDNTTSEMNSYIADPGRVHPCP